jgi:hypothetical protein
MYLLILLFCLLFLHLFRLIVFPHLMPLPTLSPHYISFVLSFIYWLLQNGLYHVNSGSDSLSAKDLKEGYRSLF